MIVILHNNMSILFQPWRGDNAKGFFKKLLSDSSEMNEENQNGKTTVWDDPFGHYKNGKNYLLACLQSHT